MARDIPKIPMTTRSTFLEHTESLYVKTCKRASPDPESSRYVVTPCATKREQHAWGMIEKEIKDLALAWCPSRLQACIK